METATLINALAHHFTTIKTITCVIKKLYLIFIFSSKFYRKVCMLPTIGDVEQYLKLDDTYIPKPVIE